MRYRLQAAPSLLKLVITIVVISIHKLVPTLMVSESVEAFSTALKQATLSESNAQALAHLY